MSVRINGVTFRSGCDINILMRSFDRSTVDDTPEAREARIQLYAARFAAGQPIFDDDDTLSLIADSDDEF